MNKDQMKDLAKEYRSHADRSSGRAADDNRANSRDNNDADHYRDQAKELEDKANDLDKAGKK